MVLGIITMTWYTLYRILHLKVFYPNCKFILFPILYVKWNMKVPTVNKKIFKVK